MNNLKQSNSDIKPLAKSLCDDDFGTVRRLHRSTSLILMGYIFLILLLVAGLFFVNESTSVLTGLSDAISDTFRLFIRVIDGETS